MMHSHASGAAAGDSIGVPHPIPIVPTHFTFDRSPWLVYWEATRACNLTCRHCRAEAQVDRDPCELSTGEGEALLDAVARFGDPAPHLVITGGDPLRRPDLFRLLEYGRRQNLAISLAPSVTDLLQPQVFHELRRLGVGTISLSLDGNQAETHDGIRGIPGCFERTLEMTRAAVAAGLGVQINTLVTAETLPELKDIYSRVVDLGAIRWSLFFLITVGRGTVLSEITPDETESLMHWLADRMGERRIQIKTTEAPHFRRLAIERLRAAGRGMDDIRRLPIARGFGVRDGNGILFVAHNGDVYPSGFLPVVAGNVRQSELNDIYRRSSVFQSIRAVDDYEGKCGICEFRRICGGSRARAFAATGNFLGSDPLCSYEPALTGNSISRQDAYHDSGLE
ncbi:MAG: TIGR04053 family radical SAM/SPASM domain-containing protein [Thermaerobacterales bacterium]